MIIDGKCFPHGMQVSTFCSLQKPVLAQSTFEKVQQQPSQVPGDLDDCAGLSTLLYDSLPPHAASFTSRFACRPRFSSLARMPHPALCPGHQSTMLHADRWALQSCNILRPNGGLLPPIYIRIPSYSACMSAWAHGGHMPPSGPVRAGFGSGI